MGTKTPGGDRTFQCLSGKVYVQNSIRECKYQVRLDLPRDTQLSHSILVDEVSNQDYFCLNH